MTDCGYLTSSLLTVLPSPFFEGITHEPFVCCPDSDCKAGKLNCDGLSGTTAAWKDAAGREFKTTHEIRLHAKSPFGVASWVSRTELDDQVAARMTIKMTCTLSESGTNATSELPDHN